MLYRSDELEMEAVLQAARQICAAARTAPKTRGLDRLHTCVLTGEEKDNLAGEMDRLGQQWDTKFFMRDTQNVRDSQAVVLIGTEEGTRGLNQRCQYCHFDSCAECAERHGLCVFDPVDLGIAVGSAVSIAADNRIDSRVLYSAGRAAVSLGLMGEAVKIIFAVPLSVSGKSPFFDRQ